MREMWEAWGLCRFDGGLPLIMSPIMLIGNRQSKQSLSWETFPVAFVDAQDFRFSCEIFEFSLTSLQEPLAWYTVISST